MCAGGSVWLIAGIDVGDRDWVWRLHLARAVEKVWRDGGTGADVCWRHALLWEL